MTFFLLFPLFFGGSVWYILYVIPTYARIYNYGPPGAHFENQLPDKKLTEKEEQNFFLLIKTQLTNSQLNASRVLKTQFKSTHNSSFAFENLKSNCQINES